MGLVLLKLLALGESSRMFLILNRIFPIFCFLFLSHFSLAQEAAGGAAPAGKAPVPSFFMQLPIIAGFVFLFWFAVIGPQRKQQKKHKEFVETLKRGDEVVASNGIIGRIAGLTDRVVTLEVAPEIEIKILRSQIHAKFDPNAKATTATAPNT